MYSVFLVEDEIVVREGIRNSINWENTDYSLVGEAPDGEMALALLKDIKPDILITDIRMPFLDGLALSRIVRKTQPWIKIIILSGHDEFTYAQEAISIGVEEYLLKPVSASDMLKSLDKVSARIEEEKALRNATEKLQRRVLTSNDVLKEKWLSELVSGGNTSSLFFEQARDFGIDIVAHVYSVAIADLCCESSDIQEIERAKRIIDSIVSVSEDVISFSSSIDTITFIIKGVDPESVEETAYSLAQGIKFESERNTAVLVSVGIGKTVNRIGSISQSWSEAKSALKYLAASGRNIIVGINDIYSSGSVAYLDPSSDPIALRLRFATENDIDCIVEQYSSLLGVTEKGHGSIGYYLLYDIIVATRKLLEDLGGSSSELFPEGIHQERISAIGDSAPAFREEVRRIVSGFIKLRNSLGVSYHETMIQRAKRYIQEHFADPDISLNTVATEVNCSPNHFSTVFSQESGETFIEYLTCTRITRAKKLLSSTKMKSSEIAYEVGYNDPHYFSFLFKKHSGQSPREYRTEINIL